MAGARQSRSKAAHRREVQAREHLVQRRITLAAIAVLAVVALVVAAGVVVTIVLPPRGRVLTVGERQYTARQVADRAKFAIAGDDQAALADPVATTLEALTREETLLQAGAPLVAEVTADDLKQAIRGRLGLADDATDEAYVKAYQAFLRETPISQEMYERGVRAQIIDDRLVEKFQGELPVAGPQLRLEGAGNTERAKMQALREAVEGGADFVEKAVELRILPSATTADIGWVLPDRLGVIKDPVLALSPGQITDVIAAQGGTSYVVYRLAERADAREYDEAQRKQLARVKVNEWIAQQREPLGVAQDVSKAERAWITDRVQDDIKRSVTSRNAPPRHIPTVVVTVQAGN